MRKLMTISTLKKSTAKVKFTNFQIGALPLQKKFDLIPNFIQIINNFRSFLHKMALNKLSIEKVDLAGKRVLMR